MRKMKYVLPLTLVFAISMLIFSGCSTSHRSKTVTSESVEPVEGNRGVVTTQAELDTDTSTDTSKETKTVKETETTQEKQGVLGTTLELIGDVLSFPFKVVAGLIEFIF